MGKSPKEELQEKMQAQIAAVYAADEAKRRPQEIAYSGVTNDDGTLKDLYKTQYTGDKYAGIANEALGQNIKGARNTAAQQTMGAQANARSQLAQRGGVQGGMASRLAQTGQQQQMLANQNITSDQIKGAGDIQQKAFDVNAGAEKANLGLMTGDVSAKNDFSQNKYRTQMAEWAAKNVSNTQKQYAPEKGKK